MVKVHPAGPSQTGDMTVTIESAGELTVLDFEIIVVQPNRDELVLSVLGMMSAVQLLELCRQAAPEGHKALLHQWLERFRLETVASIINDILPIQALVELCQQPYSQDITVIQYLVHNSFAIDGVEKLQIILECFHSNDVDIEAVLNHSQPLGEPHRTELFDAAYACYAKRHKILITSHRGSPLSQYSEL